MASNYKYMDEAGAKEIEELMAGEHGTTLIAWSLECAKTGMDVCRKSLIKNSLIAAAGAGVAAGGFWLTKKLVKKRMAKRLAEAENDS